MDRRAFLKLATFLIDAVIAALVAIPGLGFLLGSSRRSGRGSAYLRVAPLSALDPGARLRATVVADRWDAFVHYPPGPVGSVWLLRGDDDGEPPTVRCLQTICPHLGCGIDYQADRDGFICPCHRSLFDSEGRRRNDVSPRDMDELVCRVSEPDSDGRRWIEVRYEEFRTGSVDKHSTA